MSNPRKSLFLSRFNLSALATLLYFLVALTSFSFESFAADSGKFSFNLGYRNPPRSKMGANFMYHMTDIALESGFGWDSVSDDEGDDNPPTFKVLSDINGKYLFFSGMFRPYAQLGWDWDMDFYAGLSRTGITFESGALYTGGGIMFCPGKFYFYAAAVYGRFGFTPQAGFGMEL